MSISFKNKVLIILFLSIIILLLFETRVSATITGCLSSNMAPQLKITVQEHKKFGNVIVDIEDGGAIDYTKKKPEISWRNSNGTFVECPSKFYSTKKVSDSHMRITFLHTGMAGTTNEFKIYARDTQGLGATRTFKIIPTTKTQSNGTKISYYALDCFPRIGNFKFSQSTGKLSFDVTDNGEYAKIKVEDAIAQPQNIILDTESKSVTKTITFDVAKKLTIDNEGFFKIKFTAIDKNGRANYMYLKFKCKPTGRLIAKLVQNFLGCKYVYGNEGPTSFDCSGLTRYVYKQFGINIAHSSSKQRKYGTGYSASKVKAGDILCFDGHVGIYIGGGKMVHAANSEKGVRMDNFSSQSYYYKTVKLITARRLVKYE